MVLGGGQNPETRPLRSEKRFLRSLIQRYLTNFFDHFGLEKKRFYALDWQEWWKICVNSYYHSMMREDIVEMVNGHEELNNQIE